MKVSTKSWHYRLATLSDAPVPRDLCRYCWRVIANVIGLCAMLAMGLFAASIAAGVLWLAWAVRWYPLLFSDAMPWWANWMTAWGVVGSLILAVATVFGVALLVTDWAKETPPSLVGEYVRAKKSRVCPMIEFEGRR